MKNAPIILDHIELDWMEELREVTQQAVHQGICGVVGANRQNGLTHLAYTMKDFWLKNFKVGMFTTCQDRYKHQLIYLRGTLSDSQKLAGDYRGHQVTETVTELSKTLLDEEYDVIVIDESQFVNKAFLDAMFIVRSMVHAKGKRLSIFFLEHTDIKSQLTFKFKSDIEEFGGFHAYLPPLDISELVLALSKWLPGCANLKSKVNTCVETNRIIHSLGGFSKKRIGLLHDYALWHRIKFNREPVTEDTIEAIRGMKNMYWEEVNPDVK